MNLRIATLTGMPSFPNTTKARMDRTAIENVHQAICRSQRLIGNMDRASKGPICGFRPVFLHKRLIFLTLPFRYALRTGKRILKVGYTIGDQVIKIVFITFFGLDRFIIHMGD